MRDFSYSILFVLLAFSSASAETTLYVAPSGQDSNPGTRQAPLATLAAARDRVRQIKAEQPGEAIQVVFAAGSYMLSEPVRFTAEDSGSVQAPIVYRAWPGAEVRFTGGVAVGNWGPVTDQAILDRAAGGFAGPGASGRSESAGDHQLRQAGPARFLRRQPGRRGRVVSTTTSP